MRMDELARPAIEAVTTAGCASTRRRWTRVYLDWMENIRPWCISRQLWWGHRMPVWYCDACEETYVAASEPRRGRRLGRRTPTCSTRGSRARCGRSRRSAGPSRRAELRAFYPTDVLVTARDIIFLWVARMIMMGLEFTGEIPFDDVYVHSIIQAPDGRRMSKSLGHRDRPAGADRRRAAAAGVPEGGDFPAYGADAVRWGLLAMSSAQDVRFSEEKIAQGAAAGQQAVERGAADPARGIGAGRARRGAQPGDASRTAGSCRGWSGAETEIARADRALRLLPRGARALRLRLRRAVRLVPRAGQAAAARGRAATLRATLLLRADRDARARAPDDPVRDRGDLPLRPGRRGPAGGAACAARRPARVDERAEAALGAGDRGGAGAARLARRRRGAGRGARAARGSTPTGYEETRRARSRGSRGSRSRRTAAEPRRGVPVPGGAVEILAERDVDLEAHERKRAARARRARGRDRARRAQARQRGVRREGARAAGRRRPSATSSSATAARSWRRCEPAIPSVDAEDAERYLLAASCSGCGSGSTACAG